MKSNPAPLPSATAPSDQLIREYAFHLYEQSGYAPGRDNDNWQDATACLNADILAHRSENRLQDHAASIAVARASASSPLARKKRA